MKLTNVLFFGTCLLGLVASTFAQNAEPRGKNPVFGYIDPKTGMFHSMERTPLSEEQAAAITTTTGTIVLNVTIQVSSSLSTTAKFFCIANAAVSDSMTGGWTAVVTVTGSRVGNTVTCKPTIPYSWDLGTPTTDTMAVDFIVETTVGTSGTSGFYEEENTMPAVTMKVPATGTTTTKNITTTI
jgi:hypothetical protein